MPKCHRVRLVIWRLMWQHKPKFGYITTRVAISQFKMIWKLSPLGLRRIYVKLLQKEENLRLCFGFRTMSALALHIHGHYRLSSLTRFQTHQYWDAKTVLDNISWSGLISLSTFQSHETFWHRARPEHCSPNANVLDEPCFAITDLIVSHQLVSQIQIKTINDWVLCTAVQWWSTTFVLTPKGFHQHKEIILSSCHHYGCGNCLWEHQKKDAFDLHVLWAP